MLTVGVAWTGLLFGSIGGLASGFGMSMLGTVLIGVGLVGPVMIGLGMFIFGALMLGSAISPGSRA